MELIERADFLHLLQTAYQNVANGEGHCIFLNGEAGIGKTALIKKFCKANDETGSIFAGTCDALFTPRPLAPLYDIALEMHSDQMPQGLDFSDRTGLFSNFFQLLVSQEKPVILVFEDIHWADEATLDFIKFLARRITRTRCLFILTYRNDEIHPLHPLKNVLGQLPADSFTRVQLTSLSKKAVEKLAEEKGLSGENVYSISGGNPFYVNEILASYSSGIPDNIKDSILSVYNRKTDKTKQAWEILSVLPTGFEIRYLEKMDPELISAVDDCVTSGILVIQSGLISFKHELYRRTIEQALSPLLRMKLNKRILDLFLSAFEENQEIERIVHHAKNANEYDAVLQFAPLAAKAAARLGAHIEAAKLYLSAIEFYPGNDKTLLVEMYECYAYECYLTNKIRDAIIYTTKALVIWKEKSETEKIGNCMWFLSRLWWYEASHRQAESFAVQAVETLEHQAASRAKAMAFSNMAQFRMLSGITDESLFWGEKARAVAEELNDQRSLSHVLNTMGTVYMWIPASKNKGIDLLEKSLQIAKANAYHEHTARAYTNLSNCGMDIKDYTFTAKILEEGIRYCEERNLYALMSCLIACKARLKLEKGDWTESLEIAEQLIKNETLVPIARIEVLVMAAKIKMRRGEEGALAILMEARPKAFGIQELEYIIPVMCALLEYEWITGEQVAGQKDIEATTDMIGRMGNIYKNSEFAFWLSKTGRKELHLREFYDGYRMHTKKYAADAARIWEPLGCPYELALALYEGGEEDKKTAVSLVHGLGAQAVYQKWKQEMRTSGYKNIPRGLRKSTQSNPAFLTGRELDILQLLKEGLQNKEIASRLYISPKTVDHHISSTLFKLDVNSRVKAVQEALKRGILK